MSAFFVLPHFVRNCNYRAGFHLDAEIRMAYGVPLTLDGRSAVMGLRIWIKRRPDEESASDVQTLKYADFIPKKGTVMHACVTYG